MAAMLARRELTENGLAAELYSGGVVWIIDTTNPDKKQEVKIEIEGLAALLSFLQEFRAFIPPRPTKE